MYFIVLIKIFFYSSAFGGTQNQKLNFSWKIPYNLVAERSEATHKSLTFSRWCTILKIVRTFFAAEGGDEAPKNSERLRRVLDQNCQRTCKKYRLEPHFGKRNFF
jgi:hypothetical protein